MEKYIWSPSSAGFYPLTERHKFQSLGIWPDDGIAVSEEEHDALFCSVPAGKQLGTLDGKPAWLDVPPPTEDELCAAATQKKGWLIAEASAVIAPLLDAKDGSYIDDADLPVLVEWQKYRYALTKVDPSKPVWPAKPA